MDGTILMIGASGQVGTELTAELRARYGTEKVIATDITPNPNLREKGPFFILDVLNRAQLYEIVTAHNVKVIYHLAAVLSASGEKKPKFAWKLNMEGLLNVLDVAKDHKLDKVFWPSSIAVFGPTTPRNNTPQDSVMDPNTVYGISKLAGERWCQWYFDNHGVDVRSLRYPGLIGYKSLPGGGTTDYAVEIFYKSLEEHKYTCFLKPDSYLPMMYMPDAIRATLELMDAPAEQVKIRSSYNLGGISFSPKEIAAEIQKHQPDFKIEYKPDFRQAIADSWPKSIDDSRAMQDWNWKNQYGLKEMVADMLTQIGKKVKPVS
ncbi:MAG: NAD-dependent epimerase/dehydratase family protein [Bacteroidia bacterium]|nr:NAD-dependent epimerase/dehydratase family protein [Bacteroidia bacterium]